MDSHNAFSAEIQTIGEYDTNSKGQFKADFWDYEKLIHTFAKAVYGRAMTSGIFTTYEDIFQDMCETFVKAQKTFDPGMGLKFSTYLGRSIYNNINHQFKREIRLMEALGMVYLEELNCQDEEGVAAGWENINLGIYSEAGEASMRIREAKDSIKKLSPKAKRVIRELINPSRGLVALHEERRAKVRRAVVDGGHVPRIPREIDIRLIFKHFEWDKRTKDQVKGEFARVLGVKI
ncbi:hypothetical protein LJC19_04765 [Oxalobacter sp. OttesenSCG-928-P03]|nr:hypothetical protein [Oxalobacter sp. OttesenSCG-928-P03]